MKMALAFVLLLSAPLAVAQKNVGELLDAGAALLSAEEFRREIVQRVLVGLSPTGSALEVVYTDDGAMQGEGNPAKLPGVTFQNVAPIAGEWTIDNTGKICTSMRISSPGGLVFILPPRCQFWFKHADQYFLADSDTDRSARVLSRKVKQ